ncbi:hypothetical protein K503DRAFT_806903 [Rhizopogon vinicolor AM-OR11-026]|uniref:Uncharacterized protein n=1 Tax=Rhizopogon vinicolor AM-OR11-026 TaxID=1314800 RepID=A0A1B7MDK4_9AGAM|nr:hypothetical protein K503DRAFT_806903 [Rhizopogon vinicolor AM-OR11-026]
MSFLHFLGRVWQGLADTVIKRSGYTFTPCSISNLTGKIRKVNLSGGGRSSDVYKAVYSTGGTSSQVAVKSSRIAIAINTKQSESLFEPMLGQL